MFLCVNSGISVCADRQLLKKKYLYHVMFFSKDPRKLEDFLDHHNNSVDIFGICFVPRNCEMLLQS